jgi:hypothetical protein
MEWGLALAALWLLLRGRYGASPVGDLVASGGTSGGLVGTNGAKQVGFAVQRPAGNPPGNCHSGGYDAARWHSRESIEDAFADLGYELPVGRNTMNDLGPDGKIGGGDDLPSEAVLKFQKNYNSASRDGSLGAGAGGLDQDGMVGPCVLAGLGVALDRLGADQWAVRFNP